MNRLKKDLKKLFEMWEKAEKIISCGTQTASKGSD